MKTKVLKVDLYNPKQGHVDEAVSVLKRGGLVILPTETVYGLAGNCSDKEALSKLYAVKKRQKDKPFSIAIDKQDRVEDFASDVSVLAYKLMAEFWPGPLTLVLESKDNKKVGLRMPRSIFTLKAIEVLNSAVVLPSANISGNKPPITIEDALGDLDGLVDLAIDAGPTELKKESTVVEVVNSDFNILREGALARQEIEKAAKIKNILFVCTGNSCRSVMASALLAKELEKRDDILVSSAGLLAPLGLGASREVIEILAKEGLDVSGHLARRVNKYLLRSSDIILVMEKMHERRLNEIAPEVEKRVFLLKEFAKIEDADLDISDPIGKDRECYLKVYYTIKEAIKRMATVL